MLDSPLIFNKTQLQRVDQILGQLSQQIDAPLVMIADISGRLIIYRGRLTESQSVGLAALAAGSFAASMEIGRFLSLPAGFKHQLLEGKHASLYTLAVGTELLLIVAFKPQTILGLVRMFVQQAQQQLLGLAQVARRQQVVTTANTLESNIPKEIVNQFDELFSQR